MSIHNYAEQALQSSRRRRRWRVLGLAAVAAGGVGLVAPVPADAGGYLVRQCTAATPGAQASWERTADSYRQRSLCSSGGGLQIHHRGARAGHGRYGAWSWKAPAGTTFSSVRAAASLTRHGGHRGELWAIPERGPSLRFGGEHAAFRVHGRRGELARFEARLRCVRSGGCASSPDDRARAYVRGVKLRVRDRSAPRVTSAEGELLRGRVVRGERSLALTGRDRGGGVRRLTVEAGDSQLAGATIGCDLGAGFVARLVPCPRTAAETLRVATTHRRLVTGPNAIRACAEDLALAGRANRDCERHRIWVDNECPDSTREGGRLTARLGGGATATVASNRRAAVGGRLTSASGEPVAGATVCALTRIDRRGTGVRVVATRRTDAAGRFRIPLPPGPSREVFVHHAHGDEVVSRHGLTVRSRARATLRLRSPRRPRSGERLRFRGRLPGPFCGGRAVEIEAQLAGGGWQVFRTARTNRRCRFAARYRLRATTRPTRYRFRARVRAQAGYPYAAGHSAVRSKRVAG